MYRPSVVEPPPQRKNRDKEAATVLQSESGPIGIQVAVTMKAYGIHCSMPERASDERVNRGRYVLDPIPIFIERSESSKAEDIVQRNKKSGKSKGARTCRPDLPELKSVFKCPNDEKTMSNGYKVIGNTVLTGINGKTKLYYDKPNLRIPRWQLAYGT
ncbi:hypothetical protein DFH06DRAFT_1145241 [Mycena polygramma]|nr:hypothetical protein DFH06DRAFT_1145241 [Mycena polygramma]